jgi:hypothetical protein
MSASFQQVVNILAGFGVPGEIFQTAPSIVQSYTLNSSGTPNVVGTTAYTITSQGYAEAGSGGTLGFAGILANPKVYALYGTSAGALAPTLTLPDQTQAEILSEGIMIAYLGAAADIGDYVIYNDTTGALNRMAPGPTCPTGFSFANAVVINYSTTGAGLAVIQVNPVVNPIPTNA